MTANNAPASTPDTTAPATPTNFDGYLIVYMLEGEGPGIWRVTRDPNAWCEDCGHEPKPGERMYRTVALSHEHDPELGVCQAHIQQTWDNRLDPRTPPSSDTNAYMYPPPAPPHR